LIRAAVFFSSDGRTNIALLRAAEAVAPSLGITATSIDRYQHRRLGSLCHPGRD
jgi:hypothetical protein